MTCTIIHMRDVENCLICNAPISKGHDPAICDNERCKTLFDYECAFNKWAKEEVEKYDTASKVQKV